MGLRFQFHHVQRLIALPYNNRSIYGDQKLSEIYEASRQLLLEWLRQTVTDTEQMLTD